MGSISKNRVNELHNNAIAQLSFALYYRNISMILVHLAELLSLIFADVDNTRNTYFWTTAIIHSNSNSLISSIVSISNTVVLNSYNNRICNQLKPLMSKYYNDSIKLLKDKHAEDVVIKALMYLNSNIEEVVDTVDSSSVIKFYDFAVMQGMSFEQALDIYSKLYNTTNIATIVNYLNVQNQRSGLC